MERAELQGWIDAYERVWRAAGTDGISELFAQGATYLVSPWAEPVVGLDVLKTFWESERDGPDEGFTMRSEIVAVDGSVGVARVEVDYDRGRRWRDLWIVTLDADGRCTAFEEWPFAPHQPDGHA